MPLQQSHACPNMFGPVARVIDDAGSKLSLSCSKQILRDIHFERR